MEDKFYQNTGKIIEIIECSKNANSADDEKRVGIFLDWIYKQAELYQDERLPLSIPIACIPNKINQFAYNKSKPNVQAVISNYYSVKGMEYIRNTSNVDVVDLRALLDGIVFRRGNVIWVEFGFNVGCEFGGKHPAVILKNLGEALIVAPLTSGTPNNPRPADVIIDVVYGFPKRDRYTNITRITPISVYRVDLNSSIGSINSKKMKEIFLTMKQEWKL